jgi:hypothetical protein
VPVALARAQRSVQDSRQAVASCRRKILIVSKRETAHRMPQGINAPPPPRWPFHLAESIHSLGAMVSLAAPRALIKSGPR